MTEDHLNGRALLLMADAKSVEAQQAAEASIYDCTSSNGCESKVLQLTESEESFIGDNQTWAPVVGASMFPIVLAFIVCCIYRICSSQEQCDDYTASEGLEPKSITSEHPPMPQMLDSRHEGFEGLQPTCINVEYPPMSEELGWDEGGV